MFADLLFFIDAFVIIHLQHFWQLDREFILYMSMKIKFILKQLINKNYQKSGAVLT